jgi:hypothetical protein
MHQENDTAPFIDEMKDLKLRFKNAIINSKLLSYFDKLDLIEENNLALINSWVLNINELIPNVLILYPIIKDVKYYDGWNFNRSENITFDSFAERIWERLIDLDLIPEEQEEVMREFIAKDFYEYFLKTDKIGFCFDW